MKKIKYIFIVLFIILVLISILVIFKYKEEQNKISYKKDLTIKIGEKLPSINDYVDKKDLKKIKNTSIDWKDITIQKNLSLIHI